MHFSTRSLFVVLCVASLVIVGGGLALGEVFRVQLQPCYLCNFQRFLYLLVAFFALGGVFWPALGRFWAFFAGAAAAGGVATALWQSWMQYAPLAAECGLGEPTLLERFVDALGAQWPSMFMVTGFCTNKDWAFLGLSLANWSALGFSLLFALAAGLLFRRRRSPEGEARR